MSPLVGQEMEVGLEIGLGTLRSRGIQCAWGIWVCGEGWTERWAHTKTKRWTARIEHPLLPGHVLGIRGPMLGTGCACVCGLAETFSGCVGWHCSSPATRSALPSAGWWHVMGVADAAARQWPPGGSRAWVSDRQCLGLCRELQSTFNSTGLSCTGPFLCCCCFFNKYSGLSYPRSHMGGFNRLDDPKEYFCISNCEWKISFSVGG